MSWWRQLLGSGATFDGLSGPPRSGNGASSMHLFWDAPPGQWVQAEAVIEVRVAPSVAALYFWALQVSFTDAGRHTGGAHLGLQWHPAHPGSTAVNWGGYAAEGGELAGSASSLPSATGNPNTRDLPWVAHQRYQLTVRRADDSDAPATMTAWRGSITDLASGAVVDVRDLYTRGRYLDSPMVWSEVFADCDGPSAEVGWGDLRLVDEGGEAVAVSHVRVNYQTVADGGCANTDSSVDGGQFVQTTAVARHTRQSATLSRS
jgi:hypothetical protein